MKSVLSAIIAVLFSFSAAFSFAGADSDGENLNESSLNGSGYFVSPAYDTVSSEDTAQNLFDDNDGASLRTTDSVRDSTENFENSDEVSDKFEKSVLSFSAVKSSSNTTVEETSGTPANRSDLSENPTSDSQYENYHAMDLENPVYGNMTSSLITECYDFTLDERGALKYAFGHVSGDSSSVSWKITLYQSYSSDGMSTPDSFREIAQVNYTKLGEAVYSPWIGLAAGQYRLTVECLSGFTSSSFVIAAHFMQSGNYETEYNDTMTRYTELPLGKTMYGSSVIRSDSGTDIDYYMFKVSDTGYCDLKFSFNQNQVSSDKSQAYIGWNIKILDSDENVYYDGDVNFSGDSLDSGILGLKKGYYFAVVKSVLGQGVEYRITVDFNYDKFVENEINDTMEQANTLTDKNPTSAVLSDRSGTEDVDYFKFTMKNDGYCLIRFSHEAFSQYDRSGWNITLTDSGGKVIYSDISNWHDRNVYSPYIGLSSGEYYIRIDSDGIYRNGCPYYLTYAGVEDPNWEKGGNNSKETAQEIKIGHSVYGSLIDVGVNYDVDYYKTVLSDSGIISIDFSHDGEKGDKEGWIITVYSGSGEEIVKSSVKWDDLNKHIETASVPKGIYYISVDTGEYYNRSKYTLTVNTK